MRSAGRVTVHAGVDGGARVGATSSNLVDHPRAAPLARFTPCACDSDFGYSTYVVLH